MRDREITEAFRKFFAPGTKLRAIDLKNHYARDLDWVKRFQKAFGTEAEEFKDAEKNFMMNEHVVARLDEDARYQRIVIEENGVEVAFAADEVRPSRQQSELEIFTRVKVWLSEQDNHLTGKVFDLDDKFMTFWNEDGHGMITLSREDILAFVDDPNEVDPY